MSLAHRMLIPEWMDDPELDTDSHHAALQGLSRINRLSFSARILWKPIRKLAEALVTDRLKVLDVATGGGDVPLDLWRRAQRAGLRLDIVAVDRSQRALEFAQRKVSSTDASIEFCCRDILEDELPGNFDVVMCSLFLHHLQDEQAQRLLKSMANSTDHLVLVNDLLRCRRGLLLAQAATRILSSSPVVQNDGPQSVRAAFSIEEILALSRAAGLDSAAVCRHWPFRFLLHWNK